MDYWDALLALTELRWLIPIALGFLLSFFGLWFAHRRFEQASKQFDLQIRSQNQQRFFDAVRLLDSDNTAIQFGALETIQQMARSEVGEFTDECLAILNTFLGQNSQGFAWESERLSIATAEESAPTQQDRFLQPVMHKAFLTLASVVPNYLAKRTNDPTDVAPHHVSIVKINLNHLQTVYMKSSQGTVKTRIEGLRFHECTLQGSVFRNCIIDNVIFGLSRSNEPATDLRLADFSCASFNNVSLCSSNISGANFSGISGLDKDALSQCCFEFNNPPLGLSAGYILKHPTYRMDIVNEMLGLPEVVMLDASSIEAFCNEHEGFRPHGNGEVITVAMEPQS